MADPAEGAKDILVSAGVGTFAASSGWSINISELPQAPDTAIMVVASGQWRPANPKWLLDYPNIQILVRGATNGYVAARAKAQACKDALLGLPSQAVNGDQWVSVLQRTDVSWLGYDENKRPMFSLNFGLIVEPASGTNRQAL